MMRTPQPRRSPHLFAGACVSAALGLLCGCAPDKDHAIENATEAYCRKADECDWTDDVPECEDGTEEVFEGLWSDDDCEEDGIDYDGYQNCMDAISNLNCEDWTRGLSSLGACDSSDVCL